MEGLLPLRPALQRSLAASARWFGSMADPATHRLHYAFQNGQHVDRSCPVRDIGTAADLAVLSGATGTHEFDKVIGTTLQHYKTLLVRQPLPQGGTWAHLRGGRGGLGEPSSVAHSAMLMLALAAWEGRAGEGAGAAAARRSLLRELAAGLLHQQRQLRDGSFAIHFAAPEYASSAGWQLYGGEAAYALATAYGALRDPALLAAAARALRAYHAKYRRGAVDADERVFFANWQMQAGGTLHCHSGDPRERAWVAGYLHDLQADIVASRFYDAVKQAPDQQATVEVACALEGLAFCLQVSVAGAAAAEAAGDAAASAVESRRMELYAACARIAVDFLLRAQVAEAPGVPAAAVGGFPHSLHPGAGQRVDVTGHVVCSFVKLLALLAACGPRAEE